MTRRFTLLWTLSLLAACTGDIKGEKGEPGDTTKAVIYLERPSYRSSVGTPTMVTIMASVSSPAKVVIDDTIYSVETNTVCNLLSSNPHGGLDTGTNLTAATLYHLYAVPAETGTTFDLVVSEKTPDAGPNAFAAWSYIGAFRTKTSMMEIHPFRADQGVVHSTSVSFDTLSDTSATLHQQPVLIVPAHASGILVQLKAIGSGTAIVSVDGATTLFSTGAVSDVVESEIPLVIPNTIWLQAVGGGSAELRIYGWVENPAAFH